MSLILEALRKSERSRQQSLTGKVGAGDAPPDRTRMPVPWAAILGLLLIVNAVALAVFLWPGHTRTPIPATPPTAQASPPAYHPVVRPLAEEAGLAADADVTAHAKVAAPSPASGSVAAAAPPVEAAQTADVPTLDSLPADFRQSLPALHMDVHGYAPKPGDRFAVINMQNVHVGDTLSEGPKVVAIVPQGVILEYHGTRFLLPTP